MENEKFQVEEAVRFLDVLESENEEEFAKIIEMIQDVEQRLREVDYTLQEFDQKQDSNMNFFSPVGVYEEGEEKKGLLRAEEELKEKLPQLNEKMEQYKHRREQIRFLKQTFFDMKADHETKVPTEGPVMDKEQGIHILESHEHDRNRIARDLHDSSVQSLTSLVHKTELCMRLMDIDTIRVKLELQTMSETIKTIINGMREIIYDLRPMSLDNLGLAVTIDAYCLQLKKNYDIEVCFVKENEEPVLPSIYKVTLYRVLQEACGNIVKHAKASKIDILFSCKEEKLCLKISDNGIGFDTKKMIEPAKEEFHGFGLSMMKERAILLGGTVTIESVIGKGSTVSVEIPVKEKEEQSRND